MILVALSVALAEEVAKKTEKRWIYGSGYGAGGYGAGGYGASGYGSGYNNGYGYSNQAYNQAYNQLGMTNNKTPFSFTKWKFHAY